MKKSRQWKLTGVWIAHSLLCVGLVACDASDQDPATPNLSVDAVERQLEIGLHEDLLASIGQGVAELSPFTTDGCSGGMSSAWAQLAARFPEFADRHGQQPPWQECCVAHDRQYHAGGTGAQSAADSFELRRAADLELKTCVIDVGIERSDALGEIYELSEAQISDLYESLAELMYRAVRVGGLPCTTQPWRWGYGSRQCRSTSVR